MPRIGEFAKMENGFKGYVHTRDGRHPVELHSIEGAEKDGPHYQAMAPNGAEIGAAWDRIGEKSKEPYIRVSIDDMALPQKIQGNLINEGDGKWGLMWQREGRSAARENQQSRDQDRDR